MSRAARQARWVCLPSVSLPGFSSHLLRLLRSLRFARVAHSVLGIWFFATVGSLTAASRCTWAFSRDGGIPFFKVWRTVNKRYDVPLNSLILSTIVCALLGLIYLGSSAAFNAFTGVATICLGCSYGFPILCSLLRRRTMVRTAPYSLGKFGWIIVSS